jgi:phosphatidylethanolamine/phosphatidyl-N-methylethanolamine N-methyltransferase
VRSIAAPAHFLFFRSLLLNPKGIGAVTPSSPRLSDLMASRVDASSAPVLELGAGTGAITQALLKGRLSPDRLFVIERDPTLAAFLQHRFPRVRVCCSDAIHSRHFLSDHEIPCVQTVISSLPLRNLSHADMVENVNAILNSLARDGQLIQYTYGAGCPIPARRFGLEAECLGRVWQNLPPAAVWRFVRRP